MTELFENVEWSTTRWPPLSTTAPDAAERLDVPRKRRVFEDQLPGNHVDPHGGPAVDDRAVVVAELVVGDRHVLEVERAAVVEEPTV